MSTKISRIPPAILLSRATSIHGLPEEILVRIFGMLRDIYVRMYSNSWIVVTHVCRFWRQVALDAAGLWSVVLFRNLAYARIFLLRSQQVPIDVNIPKQLLSMQHGYIDEAMDLVLAQSHRFRHVTLRGPIASRFLAHSLPGGTPYLQSLELTHMSTFPQRNYRRISTLRKLTLAFLPPALDSLTVIQRLTNVSLRSLALRISLTQFHASAWGSLLAQLPRLESLILEHVLLRRDQLQEQHPVPRKVHLPNLHELVIIDDDIDAQISMLRCIVPAENVRIVFKSSTYRPEALEQSFKALEETLMVMRGKPSFLHPTVLHIGTPTTFEDHNPIRIVLSAPPDNFHGVCDYCEKMGGPFGILELTLILKSRYVSPRNICEIICNTLSKTFLVSKLKTVCWNSMRFHYFREDFGEVKLDTGAPLVFEELDWELVRDLEPLPEAFGGFFYQLADIRDLSIPNVYLDILSEARGVPTVQAAVIDAADRKLQLRLAESNHEYADCRE